MTTPDPRTVLATPMGKNDAKAETVGAYLTALLREVWREEEGFSGKRPFGNSGWQWEVYLPLVKAGFVAGQLDEDGYLEDVDQDAADELIHAAIDAMAGGPDA